MKTKGGPIGDEIVGMLIQHEEQIAKLYTLFAINDPSRVTFWEAMVQEERGHARILTHLRDQMREGKGRIQIGLYDLPMLQKSMNAVSREIGDVEQSRDWGERCTEALAHALAIEQSIVENRFYQVTEEDSPVARKMKEGMSKSVVLHVERIRTKLSEALARK